MGFGTPYLIGSNTPSAATTATVTVTSNVMGSGDLIVLTLGSSSTGSVVSSITDTQGNNYAQVPGALNTTAQWGSIWAAYEAKPLTTTGNGGGADIITATFASATGEKNLSAQGVSCTGGYAQADQVPTPANGTSTAPSVTTSTLASSAEVAFGLIADASAGGAPSGLSFTQISQANTSGNEFTTCGYDLTAATTALTFSGTIVSAAWCALIATFQLVSSKTETFTITAPGAFSWLAPNAIGAFTAGDVVAIGPSGGSSASNGTSAAGNAGGGGAQSAEPSLALTPGTLYSSGVIGTGGAAGTSTNQAGSAGSAATTFTGDAVTVTANPGQGGPQPSSNSTGGAGGTGSGNTISEPGGAGGGRVGADTAGPGGGSSGGTSGNAGNAGGSGGATGGAGGTAPTGGTAGTAGSASNTAGSPGTAPGGGAGAPGKASSTFKAGAAGANGQVTISVTLTFPTPVSGADSATGTDTASVTILAADTGTGTDTGSVHASVPGADTGTGSDSATVAVLVPGADSGTGTDTASVSVATLISGADTGTGTDSAARSVAGQGLLMAAFP